MKGTIQGRNGRKVISLNRRKAARERCLNCSAWSTREVLACEFIECHLYPFRSGQGKQNAKLRSKAIRGYCLWCVAGNKAEVSKCTSPDCSLFPYRKSTVDRSAEIKSISKLGHIEPAFGNKNENEYLSMNIE
jgi:hypothetical protein